MDVRDAVEADAERMAQLTGAPTDVMTNLVHDRTVRIAVPDGAGSGANEDAEAGADGTAEAVAAPDADDEDDEGSEILGFVSFDAQRETVHVTQLEGTADACERLLAEPSRFAREEGMSVELLVAEDDDDLRTAAERAGFTDHGAGPRFDGTNTVRYRLDPG